jgi:hypothetical protein
MILGASIGQAACGNWLGGLILLGVSAISAHQRILDFWRDINSTYEDKRRLQLEATVIDIELDGQVNLLFKNEDGKITCKEKFDGDLVLQSLLSVIQAGCKADGLKNE